MCTASLTGVMPYSETTTMRAPSRSACSISSPHDAVDLLQVPLQPRLFEVGTEALQVVVEVRQIAECQRRLARGAHVHGGPRDPLARGEVGCRSPELEQRELTQLGVELVMQLGRMRVVVRYLAAIRGVHRPRRRAPVGRGVHVVPPEHLGAGEVGIASPAGFPDLLAGDQPVRLAPQPDLGEVAKVPAVGDGAVAARHQPRGQGRLHRAGHRGGYGCQRTHRAPRCQTAQVGGMLPDQSRRQTDDENDQCGMHVRYCCRQCRERDRPRGPGSAS